MKNEDIVTYDQAVKLKELGFDWDCNYFYHLYDELATLSTLPKYENFNKFDKNWSAPTLAQVQKWLFEKCDVWIEISLLNFPNNFGYEIKCDYHTKDRYCCQGYYSPTHALSAGIDDAIDCIRNEHF